MLCSKCGYMNSEAAEICGACGVNLLEEPSSPSKPSGMAYEYGKSFSPTKTSKTKEETDEGQKNVHFEKGFTPDKSRKKTKIAAPGIKPVKIQGFVPVKDKSGSLKEKPEKEDTFKSKYGGPVKIRKTKSPDEPDTGAINIQKPWGAPPTMEVPFQPKKREKEKTEEEPVKIRKPWEAPEPADSGAFKIDKSKAAQPQDDKEYEIQKPWAAPPTTEVTSDEIKEINKEEEVDSGFVIEETSAAKKRVDVSMLFYRDMAITAIVITAIVLLSIFIIVPMYKEMQAKKVKFNEELQKVLAGEESKNADVLLAAGKHYLAGRDYEKSMSMLDKAIKLRPHFDEAMYQKAIVFKEWKKAYPEALRAISQAIEWEPEKALYYLVRGRIYMEDKQYKAAADDFTIYLKHEPAKAEGYLERGRAYQLLKTYPKALADFKMAGRVEPDKEGEAKVAIANCYYKRGIEFRAGREYGKALEDFAKAVEFNPEHDKAKKELAKSNLNQADTLTTQGKTDAAIEKLNETVKMQPDLDAAWYKRGALYEKAGNKDKAIQDYMQAYRLAKKVKKYKATVMRALKARINEQEQAGNKGALDGLYSMYIEVDPEIAKFRLKRGLLRLESKDYRTASRDLQKAIDLDPKNASQLMKLKKAYEMLGQSGINRDQPNSDEALEGFEGVLRITPDDTSALIGKAVALDYGNATGQADKVLKKALEKAPDNADVRIGQARILINRRQDEEALKILNKLAAERPDLGEAQYFIAMAYIQMSKPQDAVKFLKKAREISPKGSYFKKSAASKLDEILNANK